MSDESADLRLGDIFSAVYPDEPESNYQLARRLLERGNQYIVDALVEVGVLEIDHEKDTLRRVQNRIYRVAQPHVHEWECHGGIGPAVGGGPSMVGIRCIGCSRNEWVPNRLPIEVPE